MNCFAYSANILSIKKNNKKFLKAVFPCLLKFLIYKYFKSQTKSQNFL